MALAVQSDPYSIVIADDDEQCRDSLRQIIEPAGYRTYLAGSGEEAIDLVQQRRPHLLVCDMYMPRLTGLETVQLVKQYNSLLPCILITGNVSDDLVRQALVVRAYSVLAKPVSKPLLLYTVTRALTRVYEARRLEEDSG